jgi:hypothetical protein
MTLRAGAARVCITPPVGTWQGGYGARTRPSEGVHDDLFARALVLEGEDGTRVALVGVDVANLTHEVADGARRRAQALTGIPAGSVALCASHTHGGPIFRPFLGRPAPQPDPDYLLLLEKYLAGAVAAAAGALQPAALRAGRGEAHFNVNRRLPTPGGLLMRPNPAGPVDHEVRTLRIDAVETVTAGTDADAPPRAPAPLAVLFSFTCHATAMGASNYQITADYPGAAAAFVEGAYGSHTTALFLQGCAGDVRPHLTSAHGGFTGADWTVLARLGRELGAAAVGAAERALTGAPAPTDDDGRIGVARDVITLPFAPVPSASELRATLERSTNDYERAWAEQTLAAVQAGPVAGGVPAEVQVFRLAGQWLVTLPGEVFVEIGWRVRDAVADAVSAPPSRVLVAAYANGSIGYLSTAEAIAQGGYEPSAYRHQGRPAGYVPEAGDLLTEAAAGVAARLR